MSAKFYSPKIQYFSVNTKGNDYVIGDIHGHYDLVYEALIKAKFNEETDRLFCVGDLIDRGPYSCCVAEFLSKPFVHAVRGNHEDMLLELYDNGIPTEESIAEIAEQIGLTWWLDTKDSDRQEILAAIRKLPLVIEIDTPRGNVGLVHADVDIHLDWPQFKQAIDNDEPHVIEEALWGRRRIFNDIQNEIPGIGRVFVGHTVQEQIKKLGNVIYIDTGAVFSQHLTMVNIITHSPVLSDAPQPNELVQILKPFSNIIKPFGEYTKQVTKKMVPKFK